MFVRSLAILLSTLLPCAALILPFGRAHTLNALVAGTLAVALSGLSLRSRRLGSLVSVIGAWVALTAFVFPSTLLEETVAVSWGVVMFICMFAPFKEPEAAVSVGAVPATPHAPAVTDGGLPLAA